MKRRLILAVSIGAALDLITVAGLLLVTERSLSDIAFWGLSAYYAGIALTYALTEKYCRRRARHRPLGDPVIITLSREEWERGEKEKYSA